MRNGRLAQPKQRRNVADAQLGSRDRVENPDARRIPESLERLGQRCNGSVAQQRLLEGGDFRWGEMENVAGVRICEHMSNCSYVPIYAKTPRRSPQLSAISVQRHSEADLVQLHVDAYKSAVS